MDETNLKASGSHHAHARLAPSASERWTSCTASVAACGDIKSEGSTYSNEGTVAHDFSEAVLTGKIKIEDVPDDFRPHVKFYTDFCQSLVTPSAQVMVETQVPLFYDTDSTGTMDHAVVTEEQIDVTDLKYGAGVLVEAQDNPQLAIYALSLVRDLQESGMYAFGPATQINIRIVQPRHHADVPIRLWAISLADLEKFCESIEYAALQIREGMRRINEWKLHNEGDPDLNEVAPALKFSPSTDSCRWCPIKGRCEARAKWLTECMDTPEQTGLDLLSLLPDITKEDKKAEPIHRVQKAGILPDETLVAIFAKAKGIRQFLDDVEAHLEEQALRGAPLPGTKIVMGREGNRAWADEEAADAFLKNQRLKEEQRYNFKLKSPTQIEELLAEKLAASTRTANLFASHITRSAAKPALALESDKRPAISTADGFDNESGSTEDEGLV